MKIPSTKPEIQIQSSNPENLNSNSSPPSDLLFSLLLQITNQLPDVEVQSDELKSDLANIGEKGSEAKQESNEFLLEQLGLNEQDKASFLNSDKINSTSLQDNLKMNASVRPTASSVTNANKDVNETVSSALGSSKELLSKLEVDARSQPTENSSIPESELALNSLQKIETNNQSPIFDESLVKKEEKTKLPLQSGTEKINFKEKNAQNIPQISPLKEWESAINKPIQSVTPEPNEVTLIPTISSSVHKAYSPPLKELNAPQQYTDFFKDLGHFLNNKTAQAGYSNTSFDVQSINFAGSGLASKSKPVMGEEVKIDLTPALMNSMISEAYTAKIKIYPPELGSLVAKLKMNKDNLELVLVTENSHIKQIVESNLSVLKQHFQSSNINLTDIQVQTSNMSETEGSSGKGESHTKDHEMDEDSLQHPKLSKESEKEAAPVVSNKIVDTYA